MFSSTGSSHSAVQMAKQYGAGQVTGVTHAGRGGHTQPQRRTARAVVAPRWWGSVSEALRHGRPAGGPGVPPRGGLPGNPAGRVVVPLPRSGLRTQ